MKTIYTLHPIKDEHEDTDPLWVLMASDGEQFLIEQSDIEQVRDLLNQQLNENKHSGWIDRNDQSQVRWLTVSEALTAAKRSHFSDSPVPSAETVRKAIREGQFGPSEKKGRDWLFAPSPFFSWLKGWQIERREYLEEQQRRADMSLGGLYDLEFVPIFPLRPECELLVFGIDGVLADQDGLEVYEHMLHWFDYWHKRRGKLPRIAVIDSYDGELEELPTIEDARYRVNELLSRIKVGTKYVDICFAYNRQGSKVFTSHHLSHSKKNRVHPPRAKTEMLLKAIENNNASEPWKVWFVGCNDEDQAAARAAGVNFIRVKDGWVVPDRA